MKPVEQICFASRDNYPESHRIKLYHTMGKAMFFSKVGNLLRTAHQYSTRLPVENPLAENQAGQLGTLFYFFGISCATMFAGAHCFDKEERYIKKYGEEAVHEARKAAYLID